MTLKLNQLSYRIGGIIVFNEISASIRKGELVGLVGPNGAGKSTLLNVISGFLEPCSGEVYLGGRRLIGLNPQQIATLGLARTFQQQHVPWNMTASESIIASIESDRYLNTNNNLKKNLATTNVITRAHEVLVRIGLAQESSSPVRDLSFGQQRLLQLGMAIARPSKVLLLDEPFTGLRSALLQRILCVLKEEAEHKAVLVVDHALSALRSVVSSVWFMCRGKLTLFDDYSSMLTSETFLSNYMGSGYARNDSAIKATEYKNDFQPLPCNTANANGAISRSVVRLNGVTAGYKNKQVLKRVNMTIEAGQILGVIGLNGSGKSTLLRAVIGLADIFEGEVLLNGERITGENPASVIRRGVRLLVQDHSLFRSLNLNDNLLLSSAAVVDGVGNRFWLCANEKVKNSINHIRSELESDGVVFGRRTSATYSGGEQARVALAMLRFGFPVLLLLDEPTAGLDGAGLRDLKNALIRWRREGVAVVIVEHSLDFVSLVATSIAIVRNGQVQQLRTAEPFSAENLLVELNSEI